MSRRRSFEDDDDDDLRGRKRRRISSEPKDIEGRLESLIMRVGEKSTSSLESNLEGLAGVLVADLPNYRTKILRILHECVVKMPEKITIYTTLVGLLNAQNYNFGGEFVEMLMRNLKDSLKSYEFEDSRIMIRFLSDLVNCHVISAGSLINFLENLIEVTLEENIPQVRSDWYTYAVLSTLPWVGRELYEKKDQELDHLMRTIENYLSKRNKIHHRGLRVWYLDVPHPQEEYLDCLWAQVSKLRSDNWVERQILRPYLAFDGVLCEALQHNVPSLSPPSHRENIFYPYPTVIFRLFDYTDCPAEGPVLPGAHAVERYLIEEHIGRILKQSYEDRKECAIQLLGFPGNSKIPLEYMIVEVVFSEMFRLPVSNYLEVCLGSTLLELCKLQPGAMPQVLAQAVELLYARLETMNTECVDRFASWFAYHLSNFQFRWSWDDWNDALTLDELHPKSKFIRETLLKCLRLSYHQRLIEVLPDSFAPMMPNQNVPIYKYSLENAGNLPGMMAATLLASAIKEKCSATDVVAIIHDLPNPLQDDDVEPTHNPLKVDAFVQTLLHIASKSISHAFAALAKFHTVFKALAPSEEGQICILRNVFELWHDHQQMMCILVDKFLKTQIVECKAIANWIFSREMSGEFMRSYVWEILHLTIRKMLMHVQKLQKELEEARAKLEKSDDEEDSEDSKDNPTEEMVERMEERLENAQSNQKNLFLVIFQRFIMILTEHIARCEVDGVEYNNHWFRWTLGRLQEVFHRHHEHVFNYVTTLETLLFTSDIDHNVLAIFQQFGALRE